MSARTLPGLDQLAIVPQLVCWAEAEPCNPGPRQTIVPEVHRGEYPSNCTLAGRRTEREARSTGSESGRQMLMASRMKSVSVRRWWDVAGLVAAVSVAPCAAAVYSCRRAYATGSRGRSRIPACRRWAWGAGRRHSPAGQTWW